MSIVHVKKQKAKIEADYNITLDFLQVRIARKWRVLTCIAFCLNVSSSFYLVFDEY